MQQKELQSEVRNFIFAGSKRIRQEIIDGINRLHDNLWRQQDL